MPTYEYACGACGNEFELEQRITEPAIKKCPKCGKQKAQRLITGSNFILKGGGWYSDLYSSTSKSDSASSATEPKAAESSSDSSKSADPPKADSAPKDTTPPKPEKKKTKAA